MNSLLNLSRMLRIPPLLVVESQGASFIYITCLALCSLEFERSALGILGVLTGHRVGKLSVSDWIREKTSHCICGQVCTYFV